MSVLQLSLLWVFTGLLEKKIAIVGEKFWRLAGLGGQPGHGVVVDELTAGFVKFREVVLFWCVSSRQLTCPRR